ncbi:thioesterase II family protein [Caldifermentibacillus hisashii]|uniref:thioesterase II family protein n=1 Tax=Caldifermentibacillus hisashii TaxID=996558 RepID=UPI000BA35247|nr:thioesterase domain-containing protein [Caldifermentibacillus hisashii]PAC32315.1 thioesterase [Caldifermentibacillus hisashii]
MNRLNLFCVPFAGGSANIYNSWKKEFGNVVNLVPVELSGRGKRINEPLYNDFDEAAEDIYNNVKTYVDEPYAMFGHSMGGMLVFEVVHKIIERIGREPDFIVISGKNPPHIPLNSKVHSLEDREFLNELIKLGGINEEFLKHKELIEIFLPIMKSDFKITELYRYKKKEKI